MANNTNTKRIEKLEAEMTNLNSKMDKILEMLSGNTTKTTKSRGSATPTATVKVDRNAQREAEKAEFKANHKLVRSAKQNKELVYAEMKKQGINEFNRKDYERIAKGLGVLGKSGKVVATWEEK